MRREAGVQPLPLFYEHLALGELLGSFGKADRLGGPLSYWLIVGANAARRPEVQLFANWVRSQAALTRDELAGA